MSKKLLSVVLALALALSCFAVSAFALGDIGYESEEDAPNYTQTWALSDKAVDNGDGTYSVDVKLTATATEGDYLVGPIQFKVIKTITTDVGTLTLTDVQENKSVIPENWNADVAFSDLTGEVTIIPAPTEDGVSGIDLSTEKVIATLTYTASGAVGATLKIDVEDVKSATNPAGTLIAARMSDGNVVTGAAIVGQTVSDKTNTVTIGNAEEPSTPPTLVAVDGTCAVLDTSRTDLNADEGTTCDGYLLGFDPDSNGSWLDELFVVEGDGYATVVANDSGSEYGSGAMIELYDNSDNLVATYVAIVFGDVNGDGAADGSDISIIEEHDLFIYGDSGRLVTYLEFAGDVNGDTAADGSDASIIAEHDLYIYGETGRLNPAEIIAGLGL